MNIILYPPQNPVAFSFFGLEIRWYGIIMAFSILVGILFCYFIIKKRFNSKDAENFLDFVPSLIIISIVGARLYYVLFDLKYFIDNPSEIILINHGGLSIHGAFIFGLFYLFYLYKFKKNAFLKYSDIIALAIPLCQAIGRWGNFINQEAYGRPADFMIKMYIDKNRRYPQFMNEEYYHPAFLYESILDLILFFIMIALFLKNKNMKAGSMVCFYLLSYSIIRIIVESVRIDSIYNLFGIPIAIIISIFIALISLILLIYNRRFS